MPHTLQGVIFDVDGTLADTEEIHRQAFNLAFKQFELDWEWTPKLYEELLRISGGHERITFYGADLRENFQSDSEFRNYVLTIHGVKTEIYRDLLHSGAVKLRPGVERLLEECRRENLVLGIATSSKYANLKVLLDNNLGSEWPEWFQSVKTCDTIDEKKPSPAVYNAVLADIPVPASSCVAFEDTKNGMLAATSAQICTIITTHFFTRNHHFPKASLVIDHLGEPDKPFNVSAGNAEGADYVSVNLMDTVLTNSRQIDLSSAVEESAA
ncbi:MAG: HAD-IA family hydrolase [Pseudomonadota bacterium]